MWNPPDSTDRSGWSGSGDWSGPSASGAAPPPQPWQAAGAPGFDPADPLISPDYAGWWARSTGIIKAGWRPLLALQLLGAVISLPLLGYVSTQSAFNTRELQKSLEQQAVPEPPDFGNFIASMFLGVGGSVVSYLLYALVLLAGVRVVVAVATTGTADLRSALAGAARRVFPLIGWQTLVGLLALVAFCACVLPVFYVLAATAVLPAVVTFERGGVIARCFRLFHSDLGASVARVATVFGLGLAVSVMASIPSIVLQPGAETSTGPLVAGAIVMTVIQTVVQVAIGVVTAPMIVTAYADMRARVEPLSTPVLVQELATA